MQDKSHHLFLEQCLGELKQKQRMELISFPSVSSHGIQSAVRHLWFFCYHQDLWQSSKLILVSLSLSPPTPAPPISLFFPFLLVGYFQLFIFNLTLRCLNERHNLNVNCGYYQIWLEQEDSGSCSGLSWLRILH